MNQRIAEENSLVMFTTCLPILDRNAKWQSFSTCIATTKKRARKNEKRKEKKRKGQDVPKKVGAIERASKRMIKSQTASIINKQNPPKNSIKKKENIKQINILFKRICSVERSRLNILHILMVNEVNCICMMWTNIKRKKNHTKEAQVTIMIITIMNWYV